MKSTVELKEGMAFEVSLDGHRFMIDAHAAVGGQDKGPPPKALLLPALGGCAAMDVVSILRKMRQDVTALRVELGSGVADTHPKILKDITVTFHIDGVVDPARAWRAIDLSRETYCGVSAMLRDKAEITYALILNGAPVEAP
ncbi:OsmC family protein [Myxococcota bacterium]|nr:OsmC family protein [Myxococcota bacterium]MBU1432681.1 OsmC family protein [Myxococcota bacterium]MBU1898306.1 OsmC family protein [Myxococcota bacterium]